MPSTGRNRKAAPSVLLIELLDGLGAHEVDSSLRLRAMRRAGLAAETLVLDWRGGAPPTAVRRAALARAVAERPSEVWIAGPRAPCQALAHDLPPGLPLAWWPTIVTGSGGEPGASHAADALPFQVGSEGSIPCMALEMAPVRAGRDRAPVALWDGDFVVAPSPLVGAEGERLLRAFATATADRPELELVALAEPEPEVLAMVHALDLDWRVHFAGFAPREAEHTWLATAAAVLLPLARPLSAGLVLRTLAAGTPLVIEGATNAACPLAAWLGAPELAAADALEAILARDPRVRDACARGRARAARNEPDALGPRLATLKGRDEGRSREAA